MNSAIHPSRTKIDDGRGHSLEMAKQIHFGEGGGHRALDEGQFRHFTRILRGRLHPNEIGLFFCQFQPVFASWVTSLARIGF